jgi:hypothetical protein
VDRDLDEDEGHIWPLLGSGPGPFGSWELRAVIGSNPPGSDREALYVRIDFRDRSDQPAGGSGFGGAGFADDACPVVMSSTSRGSDPSVC